LPPLFSLGFHPRVKCRYFPRNCRFTIVKTLIEKYFLFPRRLLWLAPVVILRRSRSLCGPGPPVGATNITKSITHLATTVGRDWEGNCRAIEVEPRPTVCKPKDNRTDSLRGLRPQPAFRLFKRPCAVQLLCAGRGRYDCRWLSFCVAAANFACSCITAALRMSLIGGLIAAALIGAGNTMDQLAIAIKLLLGDSEERFIYERQLRMFQFQCWLLGTSNQDLSFKRSAAIFGAAALSREISGRSKRGLGKRDCFLLTIASKNMEQIINRCFATPSNIYELLKAGVFPLSKKSHDEAVGTIEELNTVLEVRLQLHAAGHLPSLNNAWRILPTLAPHVGKETALKLPRAARRQRQPFLYAAERVAREFFKMNFDGSSTFITPEGLLSQMAEKVNNRDSFRRLCGAAKAIANVIEDDVKWSEEIVSALANVEGELPAMEPIPAELLPQKPPRPPRRPAEETKKAARQRVGN
jgi:hypothetical protein